MAKSVTKIILVPQLKKIKLLLLAATAQLTPSPLKPELQAHVNPPFVLVQAALA